MKTFRFSLQRVLEWRELQMRTEEEKLSILQKQSAELLLRENALVQAELKAEMSVLQQPTVQGSEFRALTAFHVRLRNAQASLRANREIVERQIAEQRKRLLKAKKECKTAQKLKEGRLKQWTYLNDRELENTAAESYISNWLRLNDGR